MPVSFLPFTLAFSGLWLLAAPVSFEYGEMDMALSDSVSGLLLVLFSILSLNGHRTAVRWFACAVGIWLQFAPLVFWAENPAATVNDTLIGIAVITVSILLPTISHPSEIPPGWTYNPSTYLQRSPVMVLGFIGWLISRYLASFQLGYIDSVWDPFFGDGTKNVLTSDISRSFPVSDAGLGALSYTLEFLLAFVGGQNRWRTMPWLVLAFSILVVPLGIVHIVLVISQPAVVGAWCSFCLAAAVVMLFMIPQTVDEMVAVGQVLRRARKRKSFWKVFWVGGDEPAAVKDHRNPSLHQPFGVLFKASSRGITFPWALWTSLLTGIGMIFFSPIIGALVITVTITASAEVVRAARFINIILGLAAAFLVGGYAILPGLLLTAVSLPKGRIRETYENWNTLIV